MVRKNEGSIGLSERERGIVEAASNQGRRSQRTEAKVTGLIDRWFETIRVHGGGLLSTLVIHLPANYCQGKKEDFAFFNILGGEKTESKSFILNKCLILCGMK